MPLFRRVIESDPTESGVWYMAGQCCRFLNDIDGAIMHLARAVDLNQNEPPVFLALGIALQLNQKWDDAVEAFRRAIELDADYELAYNSLALKALGSEGLGPFVEWQIAGNQDGALLITLGDCLEEQLGAGL